MWDEKLEMCYTLLECAGCEEFIGVRVLSAQHSSTNMDFMGKVSALCQLVVAVLSQLCIVSYTTEKTSLMIQT